MTYRVTLVTLNEDEPKPVSRVRLYDVTSLEQATDYLLMQPAREVVSVNIAWIPGPVCFSTPT